MKQSAVQGLLLGLLTVLIPFGLSAQWQGTSAVWGAAGGQMMATGVDAMMLNPSRIMINEYGGGNEIIFGNINGFQNDRSLELNAQLFDEISNPFPISDNNPSSAEYLPYESGDRYLSYSLFSSIPFGIVIQDDDWSLGLAVKTVQQRSVSLTQNWNQIRPDEDDETSTLNRKYSLDEMGYSALSLSYAQPITYLNGLSSDLDHWFIGLTASYLSINAFNQTSINQTVLPELGNDDQIGITGRFRTAFDPSLNNPLPFSDHLQRQIGTGVMFDFGMTYVSPFDDDLSLLDADTKPLERSISFGISLQNIGYIQLNSDQITQQFFQSADSVLTSTSSEHITYPSDVTTQDSTFRDFIYSVGDNSSYFNQSEPDDRELPNHMLPLTLTFSTAFDYSWFALYGDIGLNLNEMSNFSIEAMRFNTGVELNVIPLLSLRSGLSWRQDNLSMLALGSSLELGPVVFDAAVQYRFSSRAGITPQGVGVTGLKIRF